MNRLVLSVFCVGMVFTGGAVTVLAQEGTEALTQQKAETAKKITELTQKLNLREQALAALPAVADAKLATDIAAKALKDYTTGNAEYSSAKKLADSAPAASRKAFEAAAAKDVQYPVITAQLKEAKEKLAQAKERLRGTAPDTQATLKIEIADFDKQVNEISQKLREREKYLNELPEMIEAKKAVTAAADALKEFLKNNPDYSKLVATQQETSTAYNKARNLAKENDAEYREIKQQIDAARDQSFEIEKKIKHAKKPTP